MSREPMGVGVDDMAASTRTAIRARRAGAWLVAAIMAAACSGGGDDPSTSDVPGAPDATATTTVASPVAPTSTELPDTTAATGDEPSTTSAPASTTQPAPVDRYPDQPADVPWPTEEWATADPPVGVDVAAIDAAVDAAFGAPDAASRLRSFVVVHRGAIVYERYHPLDGPGTIMPSFSVAKSVTSTLVGMLVDEGRLDTDAPAPIDEWSDPGDPRGAITLEQLLQMRSGLEWTEAYTPDQLAGQMFASPDWAAFVIDQPLESEPGTTFEYSTGTTAVLAEIVADQVGGPDALEDFIRVQLLEPLGITSTTLLEDPTGQFAGGLGFDSTARDFARFGLLALRGGDWDGEQIVSSDWLDAATTPSPALANYGYQWWLDPAGEWFAARGLFGQLILVAPALDLVVVATATSGGDSDTPAMAALDAFGDAIS